MFSKFSVNFLTKITKEGFDVKLQEFEADSSETAGLFVAKKQSGGSACFLTVMNAKSLSAEAIKRISEGMTKRLEDQYGEFYSTIYSIFLFAGLSIEDDIRAIIESGEIFERQKVYNIYWGVSLSDFNVLASKNQPTDIFGIRSCLDLALEELKCGVATDLTDTADFISEYTRSFETKKTGPEIKSTNSAASYTLMIINVAIFAVMSILNASQAFWAAGAIIPFAIWDLGEYYRLLTSMFLHANLAHLVSNCLSIYIFGKSVEKYFGKVKFLIIYFASGLLASVFSLLFTRGVSIGASGAVYGLIGAVAMKSFVSRKELDGLSTYIIVIWVLVGFVMSAAVPGIDVFGHLGGLLGGLLLGFLFSGGKK